MIPQKVDVIRKLERDENRSMVMASYNIVLLLTSIQVWPYSREKRLLHLSCLPSCISAAPTGQISMKFDTGGFYENLLRKPKFG